MIVHSCTSRTYRGGEGSALLLLLLRGDQVMDADKHACDVSCMGREKWLTHGQHAPVSFDEIFF